MEGLIYHPEARAEMREAATYYEECAEGLGEAFLAAIDRANEQIARFPQAWRRIRGPYRRALTGRFPYGVIYRLRNDAIYVVAVMHLKRKPGYWIKRTKNWPA